MSENAADAQDATTADDETEVSASDSQARNPQEKTPKGADADDYQAQRDAFLRDEEAFLKSEGVADAVPEETEESDETLDDGEPTKKAESEADATDEPEDEEEPTEPAEGSGPKRKHVNLSRMGEDKAKLVLFLDKNPDVPLEKAVEILGLKLTADEQQQAETEANSAPTTLQEVSDLIAAKRAERKKAFGEDLDFKLAADLDEEIEALRDQADTLRRKETEVASQEQTRIETEFETSKSNAVKYYPDAANANSALVAKMVEIDRLFEETGDDRFASADKPFLLAKLAAKELGIAPRNPNATAKKQSSLPALLKTTSPVQPARGNARTQPSNTREGTLEEVVDNVRDEDSYEAAKKALLKVA